MAVTIRALIETKHAETGQTAQFTASARTIIDKFTATNTSGSDASLAVHLVPSGASASNSNKVLAVDIEAGKAYLCAELVGHILEAGDQISTRAGAASAIAIRASGREVT
jgi:hypothetical protein